MQPDVRTFEQVTMMPSANRRCSTASLWCCSVFTNSPVFKLHTLHHNSHCIHNSDNKTQATWLPLNETSRKRGNCECIATWGRRTPCQFFSALITTPMPSNWHPILCRFGVIAAYSSNFLTFCVIEPPFGGLETTYDVHIGLIGKRAFRALRLI